MAFINPVDNQKYTRILQRNVDDRVTSLRGVGRMEKRPLPVCPACTLCADDGAVCRLLPLSGASVYSPRPVRPRTRAATFQTRLLLAPLFRWAQSSAQLAHLAADWSKNKYFFPHRIGPGGGGQFYLDVPCVLIAGWVALRIYQAASRRHLLESLVYPFFLLLCTVTYILHVVQNYRFIYDMRSLMFFAVGLYLIYFRKPVLWLVALFAVATLNRETTLLLIPFFLLSPCVRPRRAGAECRGTSPSGHSAGGHGPRAGYAGFPMETRAASPDYRACGTDAGVLGGVARVRFSPFPP